MQVVFESRDPEAARLRELAVRRVRFAMRRLAWWVPRAKLMLSDINGPRGGVDKRCQVELRTDGERTVVITAVARDWRSAIDSALTRAARVLVRLLSRCRTSGRRALTPAHRAIPSKQS
ncbi:HPF/RaiA family ribosome-associated protein [uncultured Piscinibacter sp.]|uniref:HPF/RaiA family ribosome-associated protein n=1 Tax=uncultured Piscinibacter sp. TaxID=1131835 RepID=UPI0026315FD0|nr:HPF/RaiA family ribosome-associated protein [uncultured Piscinibacter sp.]